MENMNMFEIATRYKMRFPYKGVVSVEDLWDISLEGLDSIFKQLNSQIKQASEESLLDKKSEEDKLLDTQIEIVRYIVGVKLAEKNAREQAKANREKKQKIMSIMAEKQDEALQNKSVEELAAMLDEIKD